MHLLRPFMKHPIKGHLRLRYPKATGAGGVANNIRSQPAQRRSGMKCWQENYVLHRSWFIAKRKWRTAGTWRALVDQITNRTNLPLQTTETNKTYQSCLDAKSVPWLALHHCSEMPEQPCWNIGWCLWYVSTFTYGGFQSHGATPSYHPFTLWLCQTVCYL